MPVYEFTCNACGAPVSVFVRAISSPVNAKCERCGSADLKRLVSRFAVINTGGGIDSMDDAMLAGLDENDPKAMAAWARSMRSEMGEDAGPEFDEMVERLERGESLDDDFGGDDDDAGGFDGL
ncbi:MAG TPA: zinc ribbon domain-containing protein [Dehalococcoidia bacterium]|nr:zinc ribbon domain-containing protein [Dehalococcoidia bacterium]